ncbi:uncharacterized protein LOC141641452 [Silene latifolia]|uniref:uncharacterized protein LOC141641452 n=1 Tax=Silene latifolia TaxID=37657 RepID=UPI003D76F6F9
MTTGEQPKSDYMKITPYTILNTDNPGASICSLPLTKTNYDEWPYVMHTALLAKQKLGLINGSIKAPTETSDDYDPWLSLNALAVSWIRNSIDPDLRSTVSKQDVAKILWEEFWERFSKNDEARIYQLQADLMACKQTPFESVTSYYGRLKKLWDDFYECDPLLLAIVVPDPRGRSNGGSYLEEDDWCG